MNIRDDVTPEATAEAYLRLGRSERAAARELGLSRGAVKYRLDRARAMGWELSLPISGGKLTAFQTITMPLPRCGQVKRYLLTSIQNNTYAHTAFFENVVAYGEHIGADIKVARYSYNRASYGNNATKANKGPTDDDRKDNFYDPIFEEYICDDRLELAPFLIFAGEMNIIPTASNPLSGLETYGGLQSAIFPHSKLALQSIPGTMTDGAKFNYTTGTATLLNYIQKKEGLKAEFHHAYGALIVEVDSEGDWFVRQLNADTDGTFYDITPDGVVRVCDGEVGAGSVEAITWGDIHADVVQQDVFSLAFADNGILDTLRPAQQFAHDILDFRARNHHEIKNPHRMFKRYIEQTDNVREEVKRARDTLHYMDRDWCQMVVVDSNHDNALERWMREVDYRFDPVNAIFFLECQLDKYRAIEDEDEHYHVLQAAMQRLDVSNDIHFLGPDDSYVICPDNGGGIECAMHGHLGPNGSRGSALGLARMGRRANTAHTHSATIKDGMYVAGTMSRLRLDWNDGPSSWSHSFIVTYENGKRTIVTCYNGKWRAGS